MTRIYECMFLLNNDAVREGWREAKAGVSTLIEKHGGRVHASRRWDERKLAYPIRGRRRATFLLAHCEIPPTSASELRRDLDISEVVLRYLMTSVESVPPAELELTQAEAADDFQVPEPPADDARDVEPEPEAEAAEASSDGAAAKGGDAKGDGKGDGKSDGDKKESGASGGSGESEPVTATTGEPSRGDS